MLRRMAILVLSLVALGGCGSHVGSPVVQTPQTEATAPVSPDTAPTWTTFGVFDVARMVPGHDGNMWFFSGHGDYGRITPTGDSLLLPFPDTTQQGAAIAPNPDGNVYIETSNGSTCHVYQVRPDMTAVDLITPYACTTRGGMMVSGYDQRLWLLDGSAHITRITTTGQVSTLAMPENIAGWIIRGNPTGRAMFTEGVSNAIYRIAPDDSITSVSMPLLVFPAATASDGFIYGSAAQGSEQHRLFYKIDDSLNVTTFTFNRITPFPIAVLAHKKIIIMPMNVYPRNGDIFRFNIEKEVFMPFWSFKSDMINANIGPDHNLWMTDGVNVYVGTLN